MLCIQNRKGQFIVDFHSSSLPFKFDAQFWDVLFCTVCLTCLLSLSFSIIQARINTRHTLVRKSSGGEMKLNPNLDYGFVSIYVWPLNQEICGKHSETRLSGGTARLRGLLSSLTPCSSVDIFILFIFLALANYHTTSLILSKALFSLVCPQFSPQV